MTRRYLANNNNNNNNGNNNNWHSSKYYFITGWFKHKVYKAQNKFFEGILFKYIYSDKKKQLNIIFKSRTIAYQLITVI